LSDALVPSNCVSARNSSAVGQPATACRDESERKARRKANLFPAKFSNLFVSRKSCVVWTVNQRAIPAVRQNQQTFVLAQYTRHLRPISNAAPPT
jgi:hypothetical protein